jgi:hypothetical protein
MVYVIDANVVIFYVTGERNISARCRALLDNPNPADTYILAPLAYLEIWETFIKNPARQNLATFHGATQYIVGNAHATPPVDAELISILNGPEITAPPENSELERLPRLACSGRSNQKRQHKRNGALRRCSDPVH